ncbi:MAG: hypothetical protein WC356_03350, partial [Candidatus Micrarchaeia archaeon]
MGFVVKQIMLSGQEAAGGHNLAVVEVDAVADFASLPTFQDGSIGYIKGNPTALYILNTTWQNILKSGIGEDPQFTIDGVSPFALLMTFKLLQGHIANLSNTKLTTRGDLLIRGASVLERLELGTLGRVLQAGSTDPFWQVPGSLVIEDTNDVFAPNTIQGAIDALSALLVPTVSPYYKLA